MKDSEVTITEVGPRDGLQLVDRFVSTEDKIRLVEELTKTGLKQVEVTSFVHPKAVPQFRDAEEVSHSLQFSKGVLYLALVPNQKGLERAIGCGYRYLNLIISASEEHNRRNISRTISQSISELQEMTATIGQDPGLKMRLGVSMVFGSPFERQVPYDNLAMILQACELTPVRIISLGDTSGMANPRMVRKVLRQLKKDFPRFELEVHFHDTRGLGLANALVSYEEGIRSFDSSIAGLGGCPFAPGATGNISTEDLVNMFEEMDIPTGVNLDRLISCSSLVGKITGHPVNSQVYKAGRCQWSVPYT